MFRPRSLRILTLVGTEVNINASILTLCTLHETWIHLATPLAFIGVQLVIQHDRTQVQRICIKCDSIAKPRFGRSQSAHAKLHAVANRHLLSRPSRRSPARYKQLSTVKLVTSSIYSKQCGRICCNHHLGLCTKEMMQEVAA